MQVCIYRCVCEITNIFACKYIVHCVTAEGNWKKFGPGPYLYGSSVAVTEHTYVSMHVCMQLILQVTLVTIALGSGGGKVDSICWKLGLRFCYILQKRTVFCFCIQFVCIVRPIVFTQRSASRCSRRVTCTQWPGGVIAIIVLLVGYRSWWARRKTTVLLSVHETIEVDAVSS